MGALDRILEVIGLQNEPEEMEGEEREQERNELVSPEVPRKTYFSKNTSNGNNLVGLPGGASAVMQVVISEPANLKDASELADQLKSRKQVIINLENTPRDISQRIIDFISGTVYAIEGQSQQVGKYIFVFTPRNMEINREKQTENRRSTNSTSMFFMPSNQNNEEER